VILSNNAGKQLPMASTTKIMTTLLTLEEAAVDNRVVEFTDEMIAEGSSMYLKKGEKVTLYDLAVGMMMQSGNDAANAAAISVAGSFASFADLMNEKAAAIGMTHTHFVTPSGLDDENHYSTAYDMALLTAAALKDPLFREICGAKKMAVTVSGQVRHYSNHNRLLSEYDGCIGVKTGFTKKAGRCLVSAAERDGVTLVCVTLSAPDDWNDHKKLLDAGFDAVEQTVLSPKQERFSAAVVGGEADAVDAYLFGEVCVCLDAKQAEKVTQEIRMRPFYFAPVYAGALLGEICYYYEGKLIATQLILAENESLYQDAIRSKER
jgi:D-alanyl-D-alanine carboxypeptidase/D-alanyl-D-alanine carboxypeptidase (penicillin-binding protein 5/6)